jgi:hypothetical protein
MHECRVTCETTARRCAVCTVVGIAAAQAREYTAESDLDITLALMVREDNHQVRLPFQTFVATVTRAPAAFAGAPSLGAMSP